MKKMVFWLIVGLAVVTLMSIASTIISFQALKNQNLPQASRFAKFALITLKPLSAVTLGLVPDFNLWKKSLSIIVEFEQISNSTNELLGGQQVSLSNPPDLSNLVTSLKPLVAKTATLDHELAQTFLIKHLMPVEYRQQVEKISLAGHDTQIMLDYLATSQGKWLILFQNDHELRASGGFMGSYALLSLDRGKITQIRIEDIYDADGQFEGFVEAPPGVREYLSEGRGMRLPDANWHAHFPDSAQQILSFMALADREGIELVTAVNFKVAKEALRVTGPVHLPDYDLDVTTLNVNEVLSQHRADFFPGSTQKKQTITHLFNQLLAKISTLSGYDRVLFVEALQANLKQKDILFYATNQELQSVFEKHQIAGALDSGAIDADQQDIFYALESNVGINKANAGVSRSVNLEISDNSLIAQIVFDNQNAEPVNYVNYQRLIVPTDWQLVEISMLGEVVQAWDEQVIKIDDQDFLQIGALVVVPIGEQAIASVKFSKPGATAIKIIKQPGLPATPYQIVTDYSSETILLENDTIIPWNKP